MDLTEERLTEISKLINYYILRNSKSLYLFDSVDDMRSEFFFDVLRKLSKYDEERSQLSTFVFMCCQTCCYMRWRKNKRNSKVVVLSLDQSVVGFGDANLTIGDTVADPTDLEEINDTRLIVEKLMPFINEETRLYYLDGFNQREISQMTGISQAHVSKKIRKCLNRLRGIVLNNVRVGRHTGTMVQVKKIMETEHCSQRTAFRRLALRRSKGETYEN